MRGEYRKAVIVGLVGFLMIALYAGAVWVIGEKQQREYLSLPEPKGDNDGFGIMVILVTIVTIPAIMVITGGLAAFTITTREKSPLLALIAAGIAGSVPCVILGIIGVAIKVVLSVVDVARLMTGGSPQNIGQYIIDMLVSDFWIAVLFVALAIGCVVIAMASGLMVWIIQSVIRYLAWRIKPGV